MPLGPTTRPTTLYGTRTWMVTWPACGGDGVALCVRFVCDALIALALESLATTGSGPVDDDDVEEDDESTDGEVDGVGLNDG